MDFSGKHVLVLGLGETGLAMAQWLLRVGARLRVADTRETPDRLPQLLALSDQAGQIEYTSGSFTNALPDDLDVVTVSSGLSLFR